MHPHPDHPPAGGGKKTGGCAMGEKLAKYNTKYKKQGSYGLTTPAHLCFCMCVYEREKCLFNTSYFKYTP
jgi:hypothetical protein